MTIAMLASPPSRITLSIDLRSGSFLTLGTPVTPRHHPTIGAMLAHHEVDEAIHAIAARPKRLRAFELDRSLHCSVVGTCLDLAETRRLAAKFTDLDTRTADDHALHKAAVLLVQRSDEPGRALTRVLDRKFSAVITRFEHLDAPALAAAWKEHRRRGDIAGPYWAILTHPAAQDGLAHDVFGDVHMLSHFLGASGRADLMRLEESERARADLELRLAKRQQQAAADAVLAEQRVRALEGALERSRRMAAREPGSLPDLRHQLAGTTATIGRLERRIATLTTRLRTLASQLQVDHRPENSPILADRDPDQTQPDPGNDGHRQLPPLEGRTILLIGGKPAQWPRLRDAIQHAGGMALHHDGGMETCLRELSAMMSRADIIVAVIGCVGHGAMRISKRFAQRTSKPWLPVRQASVTALATALRPGT